MSDEPKPLPDETTTTVPEGETTPSGELRPGTKPNTVISTTPEGDEVEIEVTPVQTPMSPGEAAAYARATGDTQPLEDSSLHRLADDPESLEAQQPPVVPSGEPIPPATPPADPTTPVEPAPAYPPAEEPAP